jgi:hypothetical protein
LLRWRRGLLRAGPEQRRWNQDGKQRGGAHFYGNVGHPFLHSETTMLNVEGAVRFLSPAQK